MFRKFLRDVRGDYMIATAIAIVPIMGGLALAVDYSEMTRQRTLTMNALDAAGIAAARFFVQGGTNEETIAYAKDFFEANMGDIAGDDTMLTVTLPTDDKGGGLLTLHAEHPYEPYFLSTFKQLIGADPSALNFEAEARIRLKNTLEVALVLDNSGSMGYTGTGSGKKRLELLKTASKQLVTTLASQAANIKQVDKPIQFGLVPFAASVNVGATNASADWMDVDGRSPVHHENFDWSTMTAANKKVTLSGGIYYKKGSDWSAEENEKVTRFTLYDDIARTIKVQTGTTTTETCTGTGKKKKCTTTTTPVYTDTPAPYSSWDGCVETRPYPYNTTDAAPTQNTPATLFVPMFAPDETDQTSNGAAPNSWWADVSTSTDAMTRQKYMPKYFTPAAYGTEAAAAGEGPNESCTTKAITPLTDVTTSSGVKTITDAIDAMQANGNTNVPEGMAWGWRVVSSTEPFTGGRPETEKGNDKVVIVLTDGANTYSAAGNDKAGNKSTYAAYGYTGVKQSGESYTRMFMGTGSSVNKSSHTTSNFTLAMNDQMKATCEEAKEQGIILMTVSLDLSTSKTEEKKAIDALKECASDSRFRKDAATPAKPAKLFWNTTGGDLDATFKAIADELSNLRIVG